MPLGCGGKPKKEPDLVDREAGLDLSADQWGRPTRLAAIPITIAGRIYSARGIILGGAFGSRG